MYVCFAELTTLGWPVKWQHLRLSLRLEYNKAQIAKALFLEQSLGPYLGPKRCRVMALYNTYCLWYNDVDERVNYLITVCCCRLRGRLWIIEPSCFLIGSSLGSLTSLFASLFTSSFSSSMGCNASSQTWILLCINLLSKYDPQIRKLKIMNKWIAKIEQYWQSAATFFIVL